ncbi:MAG TPA: class I SAM-dependent methyltransferase [Methanoregulaceae archaeon]|nr:class I SAM-dependent methyltransferase [Methanoregulaceae archaeon]
MNERDVLSTIKYVSSMGEEFSLSSIVEYLEDTPGLDDLYSFLNPHLTDLNLIAQRMDDDYIIRKKPLYDILIPDQTDNEKIIEFFRHPSIPKDLQSQIIRYIEQKTQKPWDDPAVLERIRHAIILQKAQYWEKERDIEYQKGYSVIGYLAYQAPVYLIQFEHILHTLAMDGLMKTHMRILDAGTGPGVVPLAIVDFFSVLGGYSADIYAIERSEEFLQAYKEIVLPYAQNYPGIAIHPPLRADLRELSLEDYPTSLDLIVVQNVLNEIEGTDPGYAADILLRLSTLLSGDGSIIVAEPADLDNSTSMRRIIHAAASRGLSIYSPCPLFWGVKCRSENCWSFVEKPPVRPTALMEKVAIGKESYRFLNTDIKYSYAILRKDDRIREPFRIPRGARYARFSTLRSHIDRRINVVGAVMSGDLGDEKNHVFKLCDGTAQRPVFAILPFFHTGPANETILSLPYGSPAEFSQVLVRYNKKHDSFNLLISRHSRVVPLE